MYVTGDKFCSDCATLLFNRGQCEIKRLLLEKYCPEENC